MSHPLPRRDLSDETLGMSEYMRQAWSHFEKVLAHPHYSIPLRLTSENVISSNRLHLLAAWVTQRSALALLQGEGPSAR
jgi:hypothetical protein